ncbi:MAG: response regulator [Thermodesulfovibrionales bacterium]|jgi:signal transduction histidine kinase/ActR/RegA family two-component response regulator
MKKIVDRLAFRIIAPIIVIGLLIGMSLYAFVLRSVSGFADNHIKESLEAMSHDVYDICDEKLNDLFKRGSVTEDALRMAKGLAIEKVEEFLRKNGVEGYVREDGKEIFRTDDLPSGLSEIMERASKGQIISALQYGGNRYYTVDLYFEPWKWHIGMAKNEVAYSTLLRKVHFAYGITGLVLLGTVFLLLYHLQKTIRYPLNRIIEPVKRDEYPDYHGIYEFEFLSSSIRRMMESLQQETMMLNNIYHIVFSKRGEDFFSEAVLAISRLFNLNSLIARINRDRENDAEIVALILNGELQKGLTISLEGSPCEGVVAKRHMVVIENDAYHEFPLSELLVSSKAESYVGFAVFNRRGEVIGLINAFGRQREFRESDIKVLQTIGQMVASEFERLDEEREREQIREQLYQAQKMEAIGTLAGGVAHDFNNMLQGILGYVSLLKIKISESDPIFKPLSVIERSAEKAAELTKQLLGFARKGKYVLEPVTLNDIVDDVIKIVSRTFDRAIEIKTALQRDLWTVEADRSQIENVILNLCLNARDATPAGGILRIETVNQEIREEEIPYPWFKAGRYSVLKISDTGMGMAEEVKKHIFEPFFTTKEKDKGTGMGLAMVYGVVKNHDGFITVDSEPGKGSAFTIYLPVVEKEPAKIKTEVKEIPHGQGTILVVDDEEFIRNLATDILHELGYKVLHAANGQEAIDVYTLRKDEIDLVILDLIMPKMGGAEAFQKLKGIDPGVQVLISSGYGLEEKTGEMINEEGIVGFIQKPYHIIDIAEVLKHVLSSIK